MRKFDLDDKKPAKTTGDNNKNKKKK